MTQPQLTFFGGKGGVGKSTVSSAFAIKCAQAGQQTLLVSTDPAHSTADVFDQEFGDTPVSVQGIDGLEALEIDPDATVDQHHQNLKTQLGEQLSPALVNEISMQLDLAHQTPGAYEAALFDRLIDIMELAEDYDRVVFDTSPTGGTLRLLSLPDGLEEWIDHLLNQRERSIEHYEKAAIGEREPRRVREGDPIISRLQTRKERFGFAGRMLREAATFYLVLNPDSLSIQETRRAIESLRNAELSVTGLVANKLTPAPDPEETGTGAQYLRARVATEQQRLDEIRESLSVPLVAEVKTRPREITGEELLALADRLTIDPLES